MIIGISGRIGSGKDTVGSIIQYLTFCKDYNSTDVSYEDFTNSVGWVPTWEIKKFAGKLKTVASLLTSIPVEKFEDQEFKQKHMGLQWKMTYREFLQKLGTEAMRNGLHTNVWVNALFADYKPESTGYNYFYPQWVITDMRFPNEMEAVEEREGLTIRVVRSFNHKMGSKETGTLDLTPLHPSETALDDAVFDYEIINDGTIEDLVEKVREILTKENII